MYQHSIDLQQGGYDKLSEDMQKALDNAVKLINGDQKVLQQTAALMLQQLGTNHIDEAKIIQGIVGENATTLHSSTSAVINELSGEGGVKKLLEGLGVKLGDIASLDIAGAINNRTPDTSVSNIETTLSTVKDSLGEDIGGKLREIELSIGTIKLSDEQKQNIKDEIAKLEGINNKTSDVKSRLDVLKEILERSDKTLQTISGNTAKGDTNVGGNVPEPQPPITQNNIPENTSGQSDSTVQPVAPAQASAAQTVTTNPDPVMAAIETGTKRSKTITAAEKKKHHALWQYLVKNMGYAPTNDTYVKLAAALGVSIKNKNKITSAEKDKILNKLKKHEFIGSSKTEKANGLTPALNSPITTQPQQSLQSALTSTPAPAPAPAPAPVDPIIEAINTGASRSKTVTKAEKQKHGDLWEYVAKKYGRSLTEKIMVKLADLLNVNIAKRSNPTNAEKDKILNKLKKKNYAKGTKRVPKDLLAWTNENADKIGSEMIVRPSDGAILTPMKAGDSVIPANLADNLFKWGAISPDKFITNPFVGKWSAEGGSSVTNNADYTAAPQTVEMHFDSLFHIEGNVDESVMPRLENLGKSLVNDKDFQKNVIKFVTKDFVRESKKQGIR